MALVLGVSAGASGARAVLSLPDRPHHEPVARCAVGRGPGVSIGEPAVSAIRTLRAVAAERGEAVAATAVTVRSGLEPEIAADLGSVAGRQHVRVLAETAAQVRYLRFTGALPRHAVAVLYDIGRSGLSLCLAEGATGTIITSRRSALVCGDRLDQLVQETLAAAGVWRDLQHCAEVTRQLTIDRVATVTDPHTGAATVVTAGDLTRLIRDDLAASTSLLDKMVRESGVSPTTAVLLGGGAQLPGLGTHLQELLGLPVADVADPASVAARGAVLLAAAGAPVSR
ncbi:hypothetical protein ACWF62_01360 [Rhodococcus sp. NPDC054953]